MELILMRHGTTQGNLERRFIGTLDVPLLPQGEELARRVGATLPAVEHIYRSPLQRCRRTAELLWPGVEMTVVDELRRKLSAELVAERAGISRATLVSIEKGASSVAIGCYAAVLHALNYMDKDLLLIAKDDELGRKLQDLDLPVRKRVTKKG